MATIYNTLRWRATSARVRKRDGNVCLVGRLLGGECSAVLHVHHVRPVEAGGDWYDEENLATVCSAHHPVWEALRRTLLRAMEPEPAPRCTHNHRTDAARRECEAGMSRTPTAA